MTSLFAFKKLYTRPYTCQQFQSYKKSRSDASKKFKDCVYNKGESFPTVHRLSHVYALKNLTSKISLNPAIFSKKIYPVAKVVNTLKYDYYWQANELLHTLIFQTYNFFRYTF